MPISLWPCWPPLGIQLFGTDGYVFSPLDRGEILLSTSMDATRLRRQWWYAVRGRGSKPGKFGLRVVQPWILRTDTRKFSRGPFRPSIPSPGKYYVCERLSPLPPGLTHIHTLVGVGTPRTRCAMPRCLPGLDCGKGAETRHCCVWSPCDRRADTRR
jgi:hypothetical protein